MSTSAFHLVMGAGGFVKAVLALLALFSVTSWGIILRKELNLRILQRQSAQFWNEFQSSSSQSDWARAAKTWNRSPLAILCETALAYKKSSRRQSLDRVLNRQAAQEIAKLYAYLPFLASTGSTAPFIGLLGTVWGIMDAFRGIGSTGSASLAVVAPAIAEALVATAAGLIAAIPAVMAYNHFLNRIRSFGAQIEDFAETLAEVYGESSK